MSFRASPWSWEYFSKRILSSNIYFINQACVKLCWEYQTSPVPPYSRELWPVSYSAALHGAWPIRFVYVLVDSRQLQTEEC